MARPAPTRVSFKLEGSPRDDGLVRARDFADWLTGILRCLRQLEASATDQPPIFYRITDLSLSSAVIELEAVPEADGGVFAGSVVGQLLDGLATLKAGRIAELPYDPATKEAFAHLLNPLRRQLRRVTVSSASTTLQLDQAEAAITTYEERVEAINVGSFSGYLDAINVHQKPVFYLYPTSGPSRLRCEFEPTLLLEQLRGAIKRYTTVFGVLEYAVGSPFPTRIVVDRIEVNPPEDELPTLRSLHGAVPDLTGGLDSVAYVRRQRNANA